MKSVALCASKKYCDEVASFAAELRKLGIVAFEPNFSEPVQELTKSSPSHIRHLVFKGATLEHFEWIRRADICYILNLNDYCGVSVTLEMGFAFASQKVIAAHSMNTGDPCRDALIDFVAATPRELADLLTGIPPRPNIR